jgi:SAM-dependent methyltransferase
MVQPEKPAPLTVDDIDDFVREVNGIEINCGSIRSAKLMSRSLPYVTDHPNDPFSQDYRDWVRRCWASVCGKPKYSIEMEKDANVQVSQIQLQAMFPFTTKDPVFIAQYQMGVYLILRQLSGLPSNEIIEYGIGWGHTTSAMLKSGFNVTAVDIEEKWLKLAQLRESTSPSPGRLRCVHGEFGAFPAESIVYGAAVFYESFHHALDHDSVVKSIAAKLANGGIIVFAAESIYPDFPIPWGVRQDGHSIWAIRSFGWMELGFNEDYFILMLRRYGFNLEKTHCKEAGPSGLVYVARKTERGIAMGKTLLHSREQGFYSAELSSEIHTRFTNGNAILWIPDILSCSVRIELKNWLSQDIACCVTYDEAQVWTKTLAPNETAEASFEIDPVDSIQFMSVLSDTHVPKELGINDDERDLGVSVGYVSFSPVALMSHSPT